MSTRRLTEITCELCGDKEAFSLLASAWMAGWKRDRWPDGSRVDLCDECAAKVLVDTDEGAERVHK